MGVGQWRSQNDRELKGPEPKWDDRRNKRNLNADGAKEKVMSPRNETGDTKKRTIESTERGSADIGSRPIRRTKGAWPYSGTEK